MKAIHNDEHASIILAYVGNYMLKYNFESNSQQNELQKIHHQVGNYMLKYNFESNSQLEGNDTKIRYGWELYAKVQF